ncbi:MAG: hypothetical protein S4CHLAM2_03840 [Chlamydiales bacterium]|nr:hypothetical protein [Chlamydiales bacterium]
MNPYSYWRLVWNQYRKRKTGIAALCILALFFLIGLYAPLFASSKPLLVMWHGKLFSPLLRYLFYPGFYTKPIDLFYNLLMFTLPVTLVGMWLMGRRWRKLFLVVMVGLQGILFGMAATGWIKNPSSDPQLKQARQEAIAAKASYREDPLLTPLSSHLTWEFELKHMTPYDKLNALLRYQQQKKQESRLSSYAYAHLQATGNDAPTLFAVASRHENEARHQLEKTTTELKESYQESLDRLPALMEAYRPFSHAYIMAKYDLEHAPNQESEARYQKVLEESANVRLPLAQARKEIEAYRKAAAQLAYLNNKQAWFARESNQLRILAAPFFRDFHWEDDAGGSQHFNTHLPWWELTRINRKDLVSSLLFGIRISLLVGATAVGLSLIIGIPLGMLAGYFAGKSDLVICRFIEIWEAMPTFFMLLLVVAITQSKSIFLVIAVLGIFGWTSFGRFIRGEVLKQRSLPYVMACKSIGYPSGRIMFSHILPNAIPPILTLLPFSMMAAITSEAGISFLGLGEEGSTSWGVLMDEGRSVFPGESYLLWPPALLLTLLLICIALVGDALRDAIDPKMRS